MNGEMLLKECDIAVIEIVTCHEDVTPYHKFAKPNCSTGELCYLLLGLDGCYDFSTENGTFHLEKTDILFLPQHFSFVGSCSEIPARSIQVRFSAVCTQGFDEPFLISPQNLDRFTDLFFSMRDKFTMKEYGHTMELKALLYQLLNKVTKNRMLESGDALGYRKIKRSILFIHEHYANPAVQITDIAAASNLSVVHFRRIFKDVFGVSPLSYITDLRIKKARDLLEYTEYAVGQIAGMSGFSDEVYFSKFFKKHTGSTPIQYRKQNKDS